MTDKNTIDEGARIVAGVRLKSMDFNGDTLRLEEADGEGGRVHVTDVEPAGEAVYDVMQGRPLLVISRNLGATPTRVQVTALGSVLGAVRLRETLVKQDGETRAHREVIQRDAVEPGERSDKPKYDNAKVFELDAGTVLALTVDGEAEIVTPELVWPPEPEPEPAPDPSKGAGQPKGKGAKK